MSSPTYDATAFLQADSDFDLGNARRQLAKWLPGWELTQAGKTVSVRTPGCEFRVHLAEESFVAEESREIAAAFPNCPMAPEIAKCERRVEVTCTDPDPDMRHFNDYLFVLHALEEFRGLILFDLLSGQVIAFRDP